MTPPDSHFVMGFLGGLAIGLVLGATFGLFIAACCVATALADRSTFAEPVMAERSTERASEWDGVVLAAQDDRARAPPDPAVLPFRRRTITLLS